MIVRLVAAALSPSDEAPLCVMMTIRHSVVSGEIVSHDYCLTDSQSFVPLGSQDAPHEAIGRAVQIMGKAMDRLVVASKDTRLVELYKAYKLTPDPEQVLSALWGIMTAEERTQTDVGRVFDGLGGSLSDMLTNDEDPEDGTPR